MSAIKKRQLISVDDYLAGELESPVKHEYSAGVVHAMAGAKNSHNQIVGNIFARLYLRLVGKACQPFNSDTKIRVEFPTHVRFYYPDASVVCESNPPDDSFQDNPVAIFEVLSKSTRRRDGGEKLEAYRTIPSLRVYVMIEPESAMVVVHRRIGTDFAREVYSGLDAILPLPEIGVDLPLSEVYAGIEFATESDSED